MAESAFTQGQTLAKVPIFSGLAENELSFLAQRALPHRYLAGELKQETGDENFVERIRIAIQQKLTGRRPNVEDIADALHISSRTLQRRLQDQGSSFQRVLEEARHQLARHYLNNSVLELNEAAYLLGYQDGNSDAAFARCCSRQRDGGTPSQLRKARTKGQTLIVTAGCGWTQRWGGPIEEVRPGDVVWFSPGEKHWHGATLTTAMTHIAIQEKLDGKVVDWMEQVSDEQYRKV